MNIFLESEMNGLKVTLEKYNLFPATFYYWKLKVNIDGELGLNHKTIGSDKETEGLGLRKSQFEAIIG